MSYAFWVFVAIIVLLSIAVILYVVRKREKITCMTGMMIAMTLGMMVGILSGTLIGILYAGNLFFSTLIAMAIGGAVGLITGAPVTLMAMMDGLLSGLMGGMMGAMLGDMISTSKPDTMMKILLVLFIGIILILFYMMIDELNKGDQPRFFRNPLLMGMIILVFFFLFNQMGHIVTVESEMEQNNHNHLEMEQRK
ncbi:hypothetical protein TEPIDINF_000175 [Tepidibacillus infernus]|uniref:Uncharacterized protein n=1 Tax=Tepidibacillus decaturensis TaxID=1413211 RepID=A0A135L232_9BACI|nr:hypothetical protein [Tepidibacillus decaturensis]KXG42923.1 hypothetical protein U473_01935 [Tepidibacillus decaturensis]